MIRTKNVDLQFAGFFKNQESFPYLYLLSKKLSEGSICINLNQIDWEKLKEEEGQLKNFKLISVEQLKKNELVSVDDTPKPMVLSDQRLYLHRYYQYETEVLNRIKNLIENEDFERSKRQMEQIGEKVQNLFTENRSGSTDWQAVAAISAMLNRFTIITGGPGTGKTTTIAKILSLYFEVNPEMKVALAAPTGKAAARMAESLKNAGKNFPGLSDKTENLIPSTIHRLLGNSKGSLNFKHNSENPLRFDLIIIDESSMLDVALFSKLLNAISPETSLIMLGDKNQLAAVEAGSLFGDLCITQGKMNLFNQQRADFINPFLSDENSKIRLENISENHHPLSGHVIELQHSYRFSEDGGIGILSRAIINNQEEEIKEFLENQDDQVFIDTDYSNEKFNEYADFFESYIKENDILTALKKLNEIRILCAVREGDEGVYALNRKVEKYLNDKKLISTRTEFYENRPLMITGNNYELNLFNGDVGIVRNGRVWFETGEGELKSVLPASLDSVETVFAMTIHKSQGSEFDKVLTILPKNMDLPLLTAELLYTAVTRSKQKVCIQSEAETILNCAKRRVERSSGISQRFL